MNTKNYTGSGWLKKFDNGGELITVQLNIAKLNEMPVDAYGNVKVVVAPLKEQNPKSKATHCVYEDTYNKDQNATQPAQTAQAAPTPEPEMPF